MKFNDGVGGGCTDLLVLLATLLAVRGGVPGAGRLVLGSGQGLGPGRWGVGAGLDPHPDCPPFGRVVLPCGSAAGFSHMRNSCRFNITALTTKAYH